MRRGVGLLLRDAELRALDPELALVDASLLLVLGDAQRLIVGLRCLRQSDLAMLQRQLAVVDHRVAGGLRRVDGVVAGMLPQFEKYENRGRVTPAQLAADTPTVAKP